MPDSTRTDNDSASRLLAMLDQFMEIEATSLESALTDAAQLVAEALQADKVDAFLVDPALGILVAVGTSDTPMGRLQRDMNLHRLPLEDGGRAAQIFASGEPFLCGRMEDDPVERRDVVELLGARSMIGTALAVGNARRGVLSVISASHDAYTIDDLRFMQAVTRWVGMLAQRAELVEQIERDAIERGRQVAADELITVLAHDLRNYISPLKMRLDLMRRKATREERERDLRDLAEASGAVDRMIRMMGDLLDVGRLEHGAYAANLAPVNLVDIARETIASLQVHMIDIHLEAPAEVVTLADGARMRQLLENLLSNAIKYAPPKTAVTIVVHQEQRSDGDWAILTVSDQGPGIDRGVLPRLFERFASGPGSTGVGLGLYVARKIAEAHGGTIVADSAAGTGTTFRVSIPVGLNALAC